MSYCDRTDIEAIFGIQNVAKWADLDNDQDAEKVEARIDKAIAFADNKIDDRLRRSVYTVPLEGAGDEDPPSSVVDMAATFAGVWLYESRGVMDFDPDTGIARHQLSYQKKAVETKLRNILSGVETIDCIRSGTDIPELHSDDLEDDDDSS